MSTKQVLAVKFWYEKAVEAIGEGSITAGQMAKVMGMSRTTCKKYLDGLVGLKLIDWTYCAGKNGVMMTIYHKRDIGKAQ